MLLEVAGNLAVAAAVEPADNSAVVAAAAAVGVATVGKSTAGSGSSWGFDWMEPGFVVTS